MIEEIKVVRINGDNREMVEDVVVQEACFAINVHGKEMVNLLCMPFDLEELAIGFLFTSGRIKNIRDIKKLVVHQEQCMCDIALIDPQITRDIAKVVSNFKIKAQKISLLMADFQRRSEIFLRTGGVHSAGIADEQGIIIFKEDIGRHNAIDKVIGCSLKQERGFENRILISSGRISSEILFKAQKAGIPILVSQSAPTNQAVNLARDTGMTLVGFARGNRMNIYTCGERVE